MLTVSKFIVTSLGVTPEIREPSKPNTGPERYEVHQLLCSLINYLSRKSYKMFMHMKKSNTFFPYGDDETIPSIP